MSDLYLYPPTVAERTRAAVWSIVLVALIGLVTFDQGAATGGAPVLHELFHDARHLLGVPCH